MLARPKSQLGIRAFAAQELILNGARSALFLLFKFLKICKKIKQVVCLRYMEFKRATKQLKQAVERLSQDGLLEWTKNVYRRAGAEIFLVGGAVRDIILKRHPIVDYDFVVRGWEINELEKILAGAGKVNLVGKRFGVFKFIPKGKKISEPLDIALPRTELSLASGGYRDFKVKSKADLLIEEDLGRRDFTVNALAYELRSARLVDEFNGLRDLKNKI